jgi:hypothetical protein
MNYGTDYGHGTTNVDPSSGIRYGVIPAHAIGQAWYDDAEPEYGPPSCPKCGNDDVPAQRDPSNCCRDYYCLPCNYPFDSDEAYGDEPLAWSYDGQGIQAQQSGDDPDVWILKSPFYTHAQFCSPCAPGACHLETPVDTGGPRCYCLPADWFDDDNPCPYPVYRVIDGSLVE